MKRIGTTQKKILLLLLGGLALGCARSPRQYFKVLDSMIDGWKEINRQHLEKSINSLYRSKLLSTKSNCDGTITMVLSKDGKQLALTYDLENMAIKKPKHWDGLWRMVMFDVPEKKKLVRESLRYHLRQLRFFEFQKSVFVHPFPCSHEIEYIVELYDARKHVRFITAQKIDNELELKRHFGLLPS